MAVTLAGIPNAKFIPKVTQEFGAKYVFIQSRYDLPSSIGFCDHWYFPGAFFSIISRMRVEQLS